MLLRIIITSVEQLYEISSLIDETWCKRAVMHHIGKKVTKNAAYDTQYQS